MRDGFHAKVAVQDSAIDLAAWLVRTISDILFVLSLTFRGIQVLHDPFPAPPGKALHKADAITLLLPHQCARDRISSPHSDIGLCH